MTNEELLDEINKHFEARVEAVNRNIDRRFERLERRLAEKIDEMHDDLARRIQAAGAQVDLHVRDPHAHRQAAE